MVVEKDDKPITQVALAVKKTIVAKLIKDTTPPEVNIVTDFWEPVHICKYEERRPEEAKKNKKWFKKQ